MGMAAVSKVYFSVFQGLLLVSFTYFAGSKRLIQNFSNSHSKGIFLSGIIGGGCATMSETLSSSESESYFHMNLRRTAAFAAGSAIFAPLLSQLHNKETFLSLKGSCKFSLYGASLNTFFFMIYPRLNVSPAPSMLDPKIIDCGPLSLQLKGTEKSFRGWCQVDRAMQPQIQDKLKELALGDITRHCIGLWDDVKVKAVLKKGFNIGPFLWVLNGPELTATSKDKKHSFALSEARVSHTDELTPEEVNEYLQLQDTHDSNARENKGYNIAIRGPVAHQYRIIDGDPHCQLDELANLEIQQMIWACWPNVRSKTTATPEDLLEYQTNVLKTLNLLTSLSGADEVISIVVPRAFMPQKPSAQDTITNKTHCPLYYAYRKAFIQAVSDFSSSTKRQFLLHAVQHNELDTIAKLI